MQKEITRTLKQIDGDIRELTKCLESAVSKKSVDEQSQSEEQLSNLKNAMKAHHAKIRSWTAQLGAKLPSKDKLGVARTRIEQLLRRCSDLEKKAKLVTPDEKIAQRDRVVSDYASSAEHSETSGVPSVEDAIVSEVKVTSEQLCADDPEEMEMSREFVCQICFHVVGHTPQLSTCSHLFCGDCIGKWFEIHPGNQTWASRAQSGGSVPCPICKEPLQKDSDLYAICPEGQGNSAVLWEMLGGLKVMCANHPKCNVKGQCTWIGDYASYQEHIHSCKNTPLVNVETVSLSHAVGPSTTLKLGGESNDEKTDEDPHLDMETTASETSVTGDSEKSCMVANVNLVDQSEECASSDNDESLPEGNVVEQMVEPYNTEERSLTSLIAELINLKSNQQCNLQGSTDELHATDAPITELAAKDDEPATVQHHEDSVLNAGAAPFQPSSEKPQKKQASQKKVAQGCAPIQAAHAQLQYQAALKQYQAVQAQMHYQAAAHAQMTQMAYLQRLQSAQMAQFQYQAALQAQMSKTNTGKRRAR